MQVGLQLLFVNVEVSTESIATCDGLSAASDLQTHSNTQVNG